MTTPKNDCRSLFKTSNPHKDSLHKRLQLSEPERKVLLDAKSEIKRAIKEGFNEIKAAQSNRNLRTVSTPLFAQQGSFVYGTLNNPAYPPIQQVDLDYGIYLPFSDLENGNAPKQTVDVFFEVIEQILEKHIEMYRKEQWKLKHKPSCVRVVINKKMHVDLPLYGCPDKEMSRVVELANEALILNRKQASAIDSYTDFAPIDSNYIHLAHREKGWVVSDPLVIRDWVRNQCRAYGTGNHLKDICRYLKAWRDEVPDWKETGGPSSILLLALTIALYSTEEDGVHAQLAEVIDGLHDRLSYPVNIPAPGQPNNEEDLLAPDRVSSEDLLDFKEKFRSLESNYRAAMNTEDVNRSNQLLRDLFGPRFPNRPEDINQKNPADTVRETPAVVTPAPFPRTTTSG
jgi:hypothetical protein